MMTRIRVYTDNDGVILIVTGADRKGKETRVHLTLTDADELSRALSTRLVARIPSEE